MLKAEAKVESGLTSLSSPFFFFASFVSFRLTSCLASPRLVTQQTLIDKLFTDSKSVFKYNYSFRFNFQSDLNFRNTELMLLI